MRDVILLAIHLLVTLAKFLRPGSVRAVAAESLALKHQLLICTLPTAGPEPDHARSPGTRADHPVHAATPHSAVVHHYQAGHTAQVPQGSGRWQIPPTLLLRGASTQTRAEGAFCAAHCSHRRTETAHSCGAVLRRRREWKRQQHRRDHRHPPRPDHRGAIPVSSAISWSSSHARTQVATIVA